MEEAQLSGIPEEEPANCQDDSQHFLWVDKFAPQHYTELLSDDVRPWSCSSATSSLIAKKGKFRIQPNYTGLLRWRAEL